MSSVIRFFFVILDSGSDVLCGLNFLRIHIQFPSFIGTILDKLGGSEDDEDAKPDLVWGIMSIFIIFWPGLVYACVKAPDLQKGQTNQSDSKEDVEEQGNTETDNVKAVDREDKKRFQIIDLLFFTFCFPIGFILHCIW